MKIEVKNWDNEVVSEIEIPETVFAHEVTEHLVWEVVRAQLAARRRGTHMTKNRALVKGTRSRHSHIRRRACGQYQRNLQCLGAIHSPPTGNGWRIHGVRRNAAHHQCATGPLRAKQLTHYSIVLFPCLQYSPWSIPPKSHPCQSVFIRGSCSSPRLVAS